MDAAEPMDHQFADDRHQTAPGADEAWRAELTSRVNSYRRRKSNSGEEQRPAFDFGPATGSVADQPPEREFQPPARVESRTQGRTIAQAAHRAFDTNYYRRLNAESLAQSSLPMTVSMGATAAAAEPARAIEPETEPCAAEPDSNSELALDLEIRPESPEESLLNQIRISEPEPEPEPEPQPEAMLPPTPPQGNLIVFRRPLLEPPLAPQPSRDELAEPMSNRPRILEVPEDIMPPVQGSLFPEIRLDADEQESSAPREPQLEVPLRVALISERLLASLTDLGLVATAGALFAGMALRALPDVPHTKPFWMMLGATTLLLWAVYQHLFLLYAGRTPGMRMRGIRLSTFDGGVPAWKQRSTRARFVFISFASVALGFIWALVDEDTLCWHDRISQTFPTSE